MRRSRSKNILIYLLLILLVCLSIGYAFLTQELTINGTSKVGANSWSIYFDNLVLNSNNVSLSQGDVAVSINQTTLTDVSYTITLQKPGDFYEFTVDVVNGGSIDAMVGTISSKLNNVEIDSTHPLPSYLNYSVTYSDGVEIAPNQLLVHGTSDTYKVRVEYKLDVTTDDLPSESQTLFLNFGVEYVQKDSNAIERPLPIPAPVSFATDSWETVIAAAKSGNTSAYHVGDTKTVELGNNLGTHTIRIANTSTPAECSTNGFSQTACGFVLEFADIITTHRMNSYVNGDTTTIGLNSKGGWEYSDMRAYLNSTTYAYENIDYSTTGIYSSLPEVLRNAIINTTVVSGHGSSDTTNFTTTDKLYLLSTHEVFEDVDGNTNNGIDRYDTAYNNTRQLDYYVGLNITTSSYSGAIKQKSEIYYPWFLRSTHSDAIDGFFFVLDDGVWNVFSANGTIGVSPAFRLG